MVTMLKPLCHSFVRCPAARAARLLGGCLAMAIAGMAASPTLAAPAIPNPSFEANTFNVSPGYISGNSAITGWVGTPTNKVGMNPAGSQNIFANNGAVPNGTKVAFIQSQFGETGKLSTAITGLTVGSTYLVRFRTNARTGGGVPRPSYRINGENPVPFGVGPVDAQDTFNNPYTTVSIVFKATAATAALEISNTTQIDTSLLVDNFTITAAVPIVVQNANSSGTGSLTEAVATAAASTSVFNVITFAPTLNGATIAVSGSIDVADTDGLAIDASGLASGITLNGGGGNRLFSCGPGTILSLRALTLTNGSSTSTGGAIQSVGTLLLADCTLSGNTCSSGNAGAISNFGTLTLVRCTLSDNTSATGSGGAIYSNTDLSGSYTSLLQCTLSGNTATAGGAIFNSDGRTLLSHCTIAGNSAPTGNGAGIASDGNLAFTETVVGYSIIADNANSSNVDRDGSNVSSSYVSMGRNLVGPGEDQASFNVSDTFTFSSDLSALGNNGGRTRTMGLRTGSLARNAAVGSPITTDQRGKTLVGTPDMGAYEMQAGTFSLSSASALAYEGGVAQIRVGRGTEVAGRATVRLFTTAGTATAADFIARANAAVSDVVFLDGEAERTVEIPITADALTEGNHIFQVTLASPTPSPQATLGAIINATVTIQDSLVVTTANDDGPGSLYQTLLAAASKPGADSIGFAPSLAGKTITLGSTVPISDVAGVTVDASSIGGMVIHGGAGNYRLFSIITGTTATLRRLTLTSGNLTVGNGGAIQNQGTATLDRCTLAGNSATGNGRRGGAIHNTGTLYLSNSTLDHNTAFDSGGAVENDGGTLVASLCTFTNNAASGSAAQEVGGAIHNTNGGDVSLTRVTIFDNRSDDFGGGITSEGGISSLLTLEDCIISGNTAPTDTAGRDVDNYGGTVTRVGNNIIPALATNNGGSDSGPAALVDDPLLLTLADNEGPTQTCALQPLSPALDIGSEGLIYDQRGFPIQGLPDLGAYEAQNGGQFVLSSTGYITAEGSPATVVIYRLGGFLGKASVRLFTTAGTAGTSDFSPRANTVAFDVPFAAGATFATVNISTAAETPANVPEANESFTVSLGSPSEGLSLGAGASATVTIVDADFTTATDTVKPTVSISSPAASAGVGVDEGGKLLVTGTATDNKGVDHMEFNINGVAKSFAHTLEKPAATSTKFTVAIDDSEFVNGTNTLGVAAFDGNSNLGSTQVTFKMLRPLVVDVFGFGTVTAGAAPRSYREVGAPQTLTATAGAGYLFAGWQILSNHSAAQIGVTSTSLEKSPLTFIHRQGLALRANFVSNPYVVGVTGTYNGSISPSATLPTSGGTGPGGVGTASVLATEGYVSVTVQNTGAFSGSLKIDGSTLAAAGKFDTSGVARFGTSMSPTLTINRPDKSALFVSLAINTSTKQITGKVTQLSGTSITAVCDVIADRAFYSATNPVPPTAFGATTNRPATGTYTVITALLDPAPQPTDQVAGYYGYGSATLSAQGIMTVTLMLPDGTPFTQSTTISQAGTWRLFAQLYPGLKGLLAATIPIDHTQVSGDFSSMAARWMCPVQDRQHYPAGWPEGVTMQVAGSRYVVPTGSSIIPLNQATGTGDGNATLTIIDGLQSPTLAKNVDISPTDAVTKVPADSSYSFALDRMTGRFSGTFQHSDGTTVPYAGAVFQKTASLAKAYGFFLTMKPAIKDYTGKSGAVYLEVQ